MKTIFDAVNEFKGEIKTTVIRHIVCNQSSGTMHYWYHDSFDDLATPQWEPLCSVEEFNALVAEMELGLDVNPVSYQSYIDYLTSNKEQLEPIKQKSKIYTQEMCDNGIKPSVGMEVVARYNHDSKTVTHEGKLKYLSDRNVILDIGGIEWHGIIGDYIVEPIILPTTLIIGEACQFDYLGRGLLGRYVDGYFVNGKTYLAANTCTNIKPLTLKESSHE